MDYQMHLYMAVAQATDATRFPAGERHPILIYLRQDSGTQHDFDAAEAVATQAGWEDVDFTKAGILPEDAGDQGDASLRTCYADALRQGFALLIYDTVVRPAPRKDSAAPPH